MKRRLLNPLTVLSLLLCVAGCVLWVRSYFLSDKIGFVVAGTPDHWITADSIRGSVWLGHTSSRPAADGNPKTGFLWTTERLSPTYNAAGGRIFELVRDDTEGNERRTGIVAPHWILAAAALTFPAARFGRRRVLSGHRTPGQCPKCGYDLRATPDRCPECGVANGPPGGR